MSKISFALAALASVAVTPAFANGPPDSKSPPHQATSPAGAVQGGSPGRMRAEGPGASVKDHAAACDGTTNDYTAASAAQRDVQGQGAGIIDIPAGCKLNLGRLVYTSNNSLWRWGPGSGIVGNGSGVQGLLDITAPNGITYSKATSAAGNENELAAYLLVNPVGGKTNYQKNIVYVRGETADPSNYNGSGAITHFGDLVGIDAEMGISNGNPSGRVFGSHTAVTVPANGNGQAIGAEVEVYNNNTIMQPVAGTGTSKTGVHIDCNNGVCTSGVHISGGGKWYSLMDFDRNASFGDGYAYRFFDVNQTMWAYLDHNGNQWTRGAVSTPHENLTGTGSVRIGNAKDPATYKPTLEFDFPSSGAQNSATAYIGQTSPTTLVIGVGKTTPLSVSTEGVRILQPVTTSSASAMTFGAQHCGTVIRDDAQSSHTLTIPSNLPIGCRIGIIQVGPGRPTILAGPGISLEVADNAATSSHRYARTSIFIDSPRTANVTPGL